MVRQFFCLTVHFSSIKNIFSGNGLIMPSGMHTHVERSTFALDDPAKTMAKHTHKKVGQV